MQTNTHPRSLKVDTNARLCLNVEPLVSAIIKQPVKRAVRKLAGQSPNDCIVALRVRGIGFPGVELVGVRAVSL